MGKFSFTLTTFEFLEIDNRTQKKFRDLADQASLWETARASRTGTRDAPGRGGGDYGEGSPS
ncbi:MAG: hypothetical protein R2762_16380 [Bryobacteraceae bacterium]